jgi:Ca2+-binding RTX toxin-like protein
LLAIVAAGSYSARVEAAPGDRIGRFPFLVPSSPTLAGVADIATEADGHFLVVGGQSVSGGQSNDIWGRHFTATGEPLGAQIQLVSGAADGLLHGDLQVALAADGTFVVVWRAGNEIQGQRYNGNGGALGPRFIVSPSGTVGGGWVDLAMAADGRFAVVWSHVNSTSTGGITYVRLFQADGQPRGAPLEVTTTSYLAQIAMSATGEFTVAWHENPRGGPRELRLRRFDAAGAPLGGVVNVASYASPFNLEMAMSPSGQLVVGFTRPDPVSRRSNVFMRRYDAAGQPLGGEARVTNLGIEGEFEVAANAAGNFVFAWTAAAPSPVVPERILHTRLYGASGTAVTASLGYSYRELSRQADVLAVGYGPDNFVVIFQLHFSPSGDAPSYGHLFAGIDDTRRSCARFAATVSGTAASDTLQGSADHDIVFAGGGNDTVYGWGGADVVCGVDGDDWLSGGSGNDQLIGGPGNDAMYGESGDDEAFGGPSDDVIDGGIGSDYCNGESHTNTDTAVNCEAVRNIP